MDALLVLVAMLVDVCLWNDVVFVKRFSYTLGKCVAMDT